jgi:hypothetical protein
MPSTPKWEQQEKREREIELKAVINAFNLAIKVNRKAGSLQNVTVQITYVETAFQYKFHLVKCVLQDIYIVLKQSISST